MSYKFNVSCPETLSNNWTKSAEECYYLGCVCSKCFLYKVYFSKRNYRCKMKDTVIELVRKIGVPKSEEV